MNIGQMWKFHGNLNRMVEMNAAGIGPNAIAGVFKDNGIDIDADDVSSMLKAKEVLTQKALPKKEAEKLINACKPQRNTDANDSGGLLTA